MRPLDLYDGLTARLRAVGDYIWPLALRIILFWEFWEAGSKKLRGSNWFGDIPWADWQKGFPWPFDLLPTDVNWLLATWAEILFATALLLGLFTRFAAVSLVVITMVATAAVHWPADWSGPAELWQGYVISARGEGNFKLPILLMLMLLPLVFQGGGRISLDHLLLRFRRAAQPPEEGLPDALAVFLGLSVVGLIWIWVEPLWGGAFFLAAAVAAALFRAMR